MFLFQQIVKKNPKDQVATYFRNRSGQLLVDELKEDWSGIEIMENK